MTIDLKQLRADADGFGGRFYATDEPEPSLGFDLYFISKDCEEKACECAVGECEPFLVAPSCERHVAEPLARMLNAVGPLLDELAESERHRKSAEGKLDIMLAENSRVQAEFTAAHSTWIAERDRLNERIARLEAIAREAIRLARDYVEYSLKVPRSEADDRLAAILEEVNGNG